MLNNLILFNTIISYRVYIAIFHRLGNNDRELVEVEFDDKDSQTMLDVLIKDYQSKNTDLYRELMRRIFDLTLGEERVRQYEKNFRKVISDITSLHKSLAISKSLRILIFLMKLDDSYDMFESSYIQNYNLFENKFVKF